MGFEHRIAAKTSPTCLKRGEVSGSYVRHLFDKKLILGPASPAHENWIEEGLALLAAIAAPEMHARGLRPYFFCGQLFPELVQEQLSCCGFKALPSPTIDDQFLERALRASDRNLPRF